MSDRRLHIEYFEAPVTSGPIPLLDAEAAAAVIRDARRIAIVGASSNPWRASNSVMAYLMAHGYECVPVNPNERSVHDQTCYATLEEAASAGGPFDIVDVFRRAELTPPVAQSAAELDCGTLWLQQGIVNWDAARIAHESGLNVVMDRCTAVDLRRALSSSA